MVQMAMVHDVQDAGYVHPGWHATVQPHHTIEDVRNPRYFWHSANRMQPGQMIWVHHPNRRFLLQLYIVAIDEPTQSIRCMELMCREVDEDDLPIASMDGATVDWGGPTHKFRVMRGDAILEKGFDSKEAARAWMDKQAGRLGAKFEAA